MTVPGFNIQSFYVLQTPFMHQGLISLHTPLSKAHLFALLKRWHVEELQYTVSETFKQAKEPACTANNTLDQKLISNANYWKCIHHARCSACSWTPCEDNIRAVGSSWRRIMVIAVLYHGVWLSMSCTHMMKPVLHITVECLSLWVELCAKHR